MKKIYLTSLAAFFLLSSFTVPLHHQHTGRTGAKYRAFTFNDSYVFDWTGIQFYNDCTGEWITLDGQTRFDFHGVYNGKQSSFSYHVNDIGIKAIGESGRVYVISGTNNGKEVFDFQNGVFTAKAVQNERWATAGRRNNFTIQMSYLFSIDANGNWTIKRDEFALSCR